MADDNVKEVEKDTEREAAQAKADEVNKTRTGIGTRVHVGRTRGKASMVVSYEAFDDSKAETLPTSIQEFMDATGVKDQPALVSYLIEGYNVSSYTAASDPLAEYVNPAWPADAQTQFRLVVRNYSRGTGTSIEDAVNLIKPGFEKQFAPAVAK